uniref:Choline transporter-like protein n=1 Tax=Heterosigma akashiwo TaxID=2829 RepID=A0A6V2WBV2_HETAK
MGNSQGSEEPQRTHDPSLGERLKAPAGRDEYEGPTANRKCTDVLFFIAIVATWVCMTIVGVDSIQNGDYAVLTNGIDYNGNICGTGNYSDYSKMYYVGYSGSGVCVSACPSTTDKSVLYACVDDSDIPSAYTTDSLKVAGGYCQYQYASYDILNRCIFQNSTLASLVSDTSQWSYAEDFVGDVWAAKDYVLGIGLGFAIALAIVYLALLRLPGFVVLMVWGSIWLVFLLLAALGGGLFYFGYTQSQAASSSYTSTEITCMEVFGGVFGALALVFVCVVLCLRDRITLAVDIMKEAAHAIMDMTLLLFFPLVKVVGFLLFLLPWLYYAVYTASLGSFSTYTTSSGYSVKSWSFSSDVEYRLWFLLFCFFWTTQFIIAVGQLVVAMSVGKWYFTHASGKHAGSSEVVKSMVATLWYHTGTAAFGSLIIAIIQLVRAFLAYVQKKTKAANNKFADALLCVLQCCLWCFEKCMKFLNKNAYIHTALFSDKFCHAAKEAFLLIARNIARVAAVSLVSQFIMIIAELFMTLGAATLCYFLLEIYMADQLTSLLYPTAMTAALAYCVSKIFVETLSMVISTILQCFIADEEMFNGHFAKGSLKEYIDKHHDDSKDSLRQNPVVN